MSRRSITKALYEAVGETIDANGYSHLPARRWRDDTATVWCRHCQQIHTHGAQNGHRAAHCVEGPYLVKGYYIELAE